MIFILQHGQPTLLLQSFLGLITRHKARRFRPEAFGDFDRQLRTVLRNAMVRRSLAFLPPFHRMKCSDTRAVFEPFAHHYPDYIESACTLVQPLWSRCTGRQDSESPECSSPLPRHSSLRVRRTLRYGTVTSNNTFSQIFGPSSYPLCCHLTSRFCQDTHARNFLMVSFVCSPNDGRLSTTYSTAKS